MIAIFSMGLLTFFAMEVSYETNVEYVISSQKVNRLKAYYAAKSGAELSLLRILLYKKAVASFGDQLGENKSMLDPIWNFPFAWPPTKFIPKDDVTAITFDSLKKVEGESSMQATYITSIESEGGKIDINDLGSDIKALRESTKAQILKIFNMEVEYNDEFEAKWRNTNFEELLNNITDWIDENDESLNGGGEKSYYRDFLKDNPTEFIPPNRPLQSVDELHMVAGMKDDFYNLLKNRITVFGVKGININFANKDILMSLDEQIDEEVAKEIIRRRNTPEEGGLFKNEDDFLSFLDIKTSINTAEFNKGGIPLFFDNPYNFRIRSTGEFAKSTREIEVVTYDVENLVGRMADYLDKQDEEESGGSYGDESSGEGAGEDSSGDGAKKENETTGNDTSEKKDSDKNKKAIPKGRPRIVLWEEK